MAIYKSVNKVGKTKNSLKQVLKYVAGTDKDDKVFKTAGINCSDDWNQAFKNMIMTKELYNKEDGRQYKHHIMAFKPGEITAEKAHKLALEYAEKYFKNFEVFVATHIDKEHVHNHFIINSVDMETGAKLNEMTNAQYKKAKENNKLKDSDYNLKEMVKWCDDLCLENGLSITDKTKSKSKNIWEKDTYQATENEKSYKYKLYKEIEKNLEESKNFNEFLDKMKEYGAIAKYRKGVTDEKEKQKYMTFEFTKEFCKKYEINETKRKVRLETLAKQYGEDWTALGIQKHFKNKEEELEKERKINIEREREKEKEEEKKKEEEKEKQKVKEILEKNNLNDEDLKNIKKIKNAIDKGNNYMLSFDLEKQEIGYQTMTLKVKTYNFNILEDLYGIKYNKLFVKEKTGYYFEIEKLIKKALKKVDKKFEKEAKKIDLQGDKKLQERYSMLSIEEDLFDPYAYSPYSGINRAKEEIEITKKNIIKEKKENEEKRQSEYREYNNILDEEFAKDVNDLKKVYTGDDICSGIIEL